MPALLLPGALAALVALVIPLIIHIARKSEQHPTDFAALRWLRQKPRPRSRLRFDEWPLLLLRLRLLALVALWLAQPVLFDAGDDSPYVAVGPGARFDAPPEGNRVHWLAPGFPALDEPRPTGPLPLASLIRQLDAELPTDTPLTIVTPQVIEGADADRLRLSRKVTWRIVPGAMPASRFTPAPIPILAIRHDAAHRPALRYLRAAALSWRPAGRAAPIDTGMLDAPLPDQSHTLIWLSGATIPQSVTQWIAEGRTALVASDAIIPAGQTMIPLWRDPLGVPLAQMKPLGKGRLIRFTRPVAPASMPVVLEADFPAQLRGLLTTAPASPSRATAADYAPLTGGRAYDQPPQPLRPWIALLIALLLLTERWLATARRRSLQP